MISQLSRPSRQPRTLGPATADRGQCNSAACSGTSALGQIPDQPVRRDAIGRPLPRHHRNYPPLPCAGITSRNDQQLTRPWRGGNQRAVFRPDGTATRRSPSTREPGVIGHQNRHRVLMGVALQYRAIHVIAFLANQHACCVQVGASNGSRCRVAGVGKSAQTASATVSLPIRKVEPPKPGA